MRQKSGPEKQPAEDAIRDIRRATRRHFSAEEKIRIVVEGLRGEESIAELCRGEGSPPRSASVEGGRSRSHTRKPIAQKKHDRGWGRRGMRYSASDKTGIIRLVE